MRRLLPLLPLLAACARPPSPGATVAPAAIPAAVAAAAAPSWARAGDTSNAQGSTFVCQGEGASEDASIAAAHGICNDKICKLCGVEVESVVQTTETLKGVDMQRKVIERCRRFRKAPPKVERKSSDCGPGGCVTWLQITFSKEDEKTECSAFASEHFADPDECERLIEAYRSHTGRNAASFRERASFLDQALVACKDIDVRPTPLLDALLEKLAVGMEVSGLRGAAAHHYSIPAPLAQRLRETKTLLGRITQVRDFMANRALAFDVIEATDDDALDTPAGASRLLGALKAAPAGAQYGFPDVHFFCIYMLADLHVDLSALARFYREAYPPEVITYPEALQLAHVFARDRLIDETEWKYLFTAHRKHPCDTCLLALLETANHGSPQTRDDRFFAALQTGLERARRPEDRLRRTATMIPKDADFMLHIRTRLPAELKAAFDWEFLKTRLERASDEDDLKNLPQILALLSATLVAKPAAAVDFNYCNALPDRLALLARERAPWPPVDEHVCSCLSGPMRKEGTRVLVSKSEIYDYALARSLPCVQP